MGYILRKDYYVELFGTSTKALAEKKIIPYISKRFGLLNIQIKIVNYREYTYFLYKFSYYTYLEEFYNNPAFGGGYCNSFCLCKYLQKHSRIATHWILIQFFIWSFNCYWYSFYLQHCFEMLQTLQEYGNISFLVRVVINIWTKNKSDFCYSWCSKQNHIFVIFIKTQQECSCLI